MANDDSNHRARCWVFTLNNYTKAEVRKLKTYAEEGPVKYLVFGKEVGKTGVPHLQGYIQLERAVAGQTIKNQSTKRLWLGIANGSPQKNEEYCTKQDTTPWRWGEIDLNAGADMQKKNASKKGGDKTKAMWTEVKDDIFKGATEKQMIDKYPNLYFRYHAGITRGITVANAVPRRDFKTCVHVYTGRPGCGKTQAAIKECGGDHFEYSSPNKIWWTGYNGTQAVLFDDFHGNYPFDEFKKLTDQYPHKVPVHNGMMNFASRLMVITSNKLVSEWWKDEVLGTHGMSALFRRINVYKMWNENTKSFIDVDTSHDLWNGGCCCIDPSLADTLPLPDDPGTPDVAMALENTQLDLSFSEFVPVPVAPKPLQLSPLTLSSKKRKSVEPPQPPKKGKTVPRFPGKTIGEMTKKLDDLYGPHEPIVVSDDEDSIDSFDSDSDDSDSISSSLE